MDTQQTAVPIDEVVTGYFDAWNETDAAARRTALAAIRSSPPRGTMRSLR